MDAWTAASPFRYAGVFRSACVRGVAISGRDLDRLFFALVEVSDVRVVRPDPHGGADATWAPATHADRAALWRMQYGRETVAEVCAQLGRLFSARPHLLGVPLFTSLPRDVRDTVLAFLNATEQGRLVKAGPAAAATVSLASEIDSHDGSRLSYPLAGPDADDAAALVHALLVVYEHRSRTDAGAQAVFAVIRNFTEWVDDEERVDGDPIHGSSYEVTIVRLGLTDHGELGLSLFTYRTDGTGGLKVVGGRLRSEYAWQETEATLDLDAPIGEAEERGLTQVTGWMRAARAVALKLRSDVPFVDGEIVDGSAALRRSILIAVDRHFLADVLEVNRIGGTPSRRVELTPVLRDGLMRAAEAQRAGSDTNAVARPGDGLATLAMVYSTTMPYASTDWRKSRGGGK